MIHSSLWGGNYGDSAQIHRLAAYGYDDTGNRTNLTYGNGVVQSYGYDPVSRLTTLTTNLTDTNDLTIGGSTTPIAYNPASQILSAPRSNDAFSWNGAVAVNRSYAANGLNQYTAAGAASFTYDAKGNLTSDGTNTYGYSSENLLTSAPGATLGYDPFLRLTQVAGSTTTRLAYDGLHIIADYDGANTLQHRYVFGPGVDQPIVEYAGSGTTARTFLSVDERGSIIARSGSTGALATANTYDEYGIPGSGNAGLFQYTGQAWISQLGFYYYKSRMYSPTLGRFMQTDPLGYGGDGPNLYAYVLNDPANMVDSLGLCGGPSAWVDGKIVITGCETSDTGGAGGGSPPNLFSGPPDPDDPIIVRGKRPKQSQLPPAPQNASVCSVSPKTLDRYLSSKKSPMAGQGAGIFAAGQGNNIDPRLLVALAGAETGFGTHDGWGTNNAWNWIKGRSYSSYAAGAAVVASGLRRLYNLPKGDFNSQYVGKYCRGSDCLNGRANLNKFMKEQGGNMNALTFPCPKKPS